MSVYLAVCKQRGEDLGDPVTCGRMSLVDRRRRWLLYSNSRQAESIVVMVVTSKVVNML